MCNNISQWYNRVYWMWSQPSASIINNNLWAISVLFVYLYGLKCTSTGSKNRLNMPPDLCLLTQTTITSFMLFVKEQPPQIQSTVVLGMRRWAFTWQHSPQLVLISLSLLLVHPRMVYVSADGCSALCSSCIFTHVFFSSWWWNVLAGVRVHHLCVVFAWACCSVLLLLLVCHWFLMICLKLRTSILSILSQCVHTDYVKMLCITRTQLVHSNEWKVPRGLMDTFHPQRPPS